MSAISPHPEASNPSHVPAGGAPVGTPPGAHPVESRPGTIAWAFGFLIFLPIPFVNLLVTAITHVVAGLAQRKHGGLAEVNGIRAANWGFTLLLWPVLMAVTMTIGALTGTPSPSGGVYFLPAVQTIAFILLALYFLLCLVAIVFAIVGTLQAGKQGPVKLPVIPFIRAPKA
jgi:uncharacterized Tic20 family protein